MAVVAAALAMTGCDVKSKASAEESESTAKAGVGSGSDAAPKAASASAPANTGKFIYKMDPADSAELKIYEALFKPGSRIEAVVTAMGVYALPRNVPVVAGQCGRVNASYMPSKHAISICYELADAFYKNFLDAGRDDPTASKLTLDALTFTVLHEMGHALVQELELGVTGGEEDAVDDLAALILIQNKKADWAIAGPQALISLTKNHPPKYFAEHSVSEQRLGNVLCMVFGSDPQGQQNMLETIPELRPRAPKCPKEYTQKDKAWTMLLEPHTRKAG
mgnify:CR=1 FL=1